MPQSPAAPLPKTTSSPSQLGLDAESAAMHTLHEDSVDADVARGYSAVSGPGTAATTAAAVADGVMHADSAQADVAKDDSAAAGSGSAAAKETADGVTWVPLQLTMGMPLVPEALNRMVCENAQVCHLPPSFVGRPADVVCVAIVFSADHSRAHADPDRNLQQSYRVARYVSPHT